MIVDPDDEARLFHDLRNSSAFCTEGDAGRAGSCTVRDDFSSIGRALARPDPDAARSITDIFCGRCTGQSELRLIESKKGSEASVRSAGYAASQGIDGYPAKDRGGPAAWGAGEWKCSDLGRSSNLEGHIMKAGIIPSAVAASAFASLGLGLVAPAAAQDSDLAKKMSNPVAALISVPIQYDYNGRIGEKEGAQITVNIEPVIPISIGRDLNLVSRTILPVKWQNDVAGNSGRQAGLGDTVQSFFISPKAPTSGGLIWGAGPAFLLPTGTDHLLGDKKWGIGPTAVALKQSGPWTYGMLANHLWSFAGAGQRDGVSATFAEPFLSYTTGDAWTLGINTETSYDWKSSSWSVPVNVQLSKLTAIGGQPVSLQTGVRYWAASAPGGPDGLGFRATITLLFPRK
ncbi:hypothetical protein ACIPPQ_18940 [Sphingopyxis sp. LARHCG72]